MMRIAFHVPLFVLILLVAPKKAWADSISYGPLSGGITVRGIIDDPGGYVLPPGPRTFSAHAGFYKDLVRGYVLTGADFVWPGPPPNVWSVFLQRYIHLGLLSFSFGGEFAQDWMSVQGNYDGTGDLVINLPGTSLRLHDTITSVEYTAPESSSLALLMVGLVCAIAFGRRVGYKRLSSSK